MYRFGISGIPLSSKGRMLKDAIEDTYEMGLNALEIPFFKVNVVEVEASDEVGLSPREVLPSTRDESKIIVDIFRPDENGDYRSIGINSKIEENDILRILQWNLARSYEELRDLGRMAHELDLRLTVHTPNYIDLTSENEFTEKCMNYIYWSSLISNELGALGVVFNLGLYNPNDSKGDMKKIIENIKILKERAQREKLNVNFYVETSGKRQVAGSVDEVIQVSTKVKGVFPVLNFPKIAARSGKILSSTKDFENLIARVEKFYMDSIYMQYAGLEFSVENVMRLAPIKKGEIKFENLAEVLLEIDKETTIISVSPLLEHDAQYMRVILERLIEKRIGK
ncbi:MAG: TIM barrel protein [Thermoplasmata archaeon]|jgi:deoxyribonuclease-4|nr:AP endonuclease [Thermoplasmatales archaeon]PMP73443.1 MAG: AP endonuclease [Aciduliprofundum sp.]HEU12591.1 AP endonuclease [Euryarchaeota archaeon]